MREWVTNSRSPWTKIGSGVEKGSTLEPLLFLVFINDLPQIVNSPRSIYTDGLEFRGTIGRLEDRWQLQEDLGILACWSETWGLLVTYEKCVHMRAGPWKKPDVYNYFFRGFLIRQTDGECGQGVSVIFVEDLHSYRDNLPLRMGRSGGHPAFLQLVIVRPSQAAAYHLLAPTTEVWIGCCSPVSGCEIHKAG